MQQEASLVYFMTLKDIKQHLFHSEEIGHVQAKLQCSNHRAAHVKVYNMETKYYNKNKQNHCLCLNTFRILGVFFNFGSEIGKVLVKFV